MRTNITKIFMKLLQSPKITFYVINSHVPFSFTDSTNRCKARHVILNRSDVESIFLALEQLHGSLSDIDAHQDLQQPKFFIPELKLKENGLYTTFFYVTIQYTYSCTPALYIPSLPQQLNTYENSKNFFMRTPLSRKVTKLCPFLRSINKHSIPQS